MSLWRIAAVVLSIGASIQAQSSAASIHIPGAALTAQDRFEWVVLKTLGSKNLVAGVAVAGFQTWRDEPETYGTHWDGVAKRYGIRLGVGGTSNALEAGFGGFWDEDPRDYRAAGQPVKVRLGHVFKLAFMTYNKTGDPQLAYARYIAVPGGHSDFEHLAAGRAFHRRTCDTSGRNRFSQPNRRQFFP